MPLSARSGALAVIAAGVVTGVAGCGFGGASPGASSTASPSATPATASTVVPVPSSVQHIPGQPPIIHYGTVADPQLGVAYEYHLYVHCGVRAAQFGGRWWLSMGPGDGVEPPNDGSQYVVGSMTLVEPAVARFEWDGGSADFVPADVEPQPCD